MNKELKKSIEQAQIKWLQQQIEERDKIIDLMANDLATDYHSKEWVINYYMEKVNERNNN